ncbi:Uncharacterised protein [uncultured archaeon]|nr:Uncharacterised protein [uncultured archaeon]
MKEKLISLSQQNKNNRFLKNKIELRCKCGYCESITYYDYLTSGEFNIGEPTTTISPFISEAVYDETISVTPLSSSKKCPACGKEIIAVFPLSLEELIPLLQSRPPDPHMYG